MTCPRIRRWLRRGVWLVASLPVVWGLVLALMPTEWVRARLVSRLSLSTSQEASLGEVRVGPLGGLHLRALTISEPGHEHQPWLEVDHVVVMPRLGRLLAGQLEVQTVQASGVTLRAERRLGGKYPFASLFEEDATKSPDQGADQERWEHQYDPSDVVAFELRDLKATVVDEPTGTRLSFTEVAGRGMWRPDHATLQNMQGELNGGQFELEAEMERAAMGPTFEVQLKARGVAIGGGMNLLSYVVPILSKSRGDLQGKMDLNLYLRGEGDSLAALRESVVGQGAIVLDPIELRDSTLVTELSQVLKMPDRVRIGTVRSDFGVVKGRIISNEMVVDAGGVPFVLSGCTDFQGNIDYRVRSQAVNDALAPYLSSLPIGINDVVELRIKGTRDQMSATVEGIPLRDEMGRPLSDKERIREIGRVLRDRLLR